MELSVAIGYQISLRGRRSWSGSEHVVSVARCFPLIERALASSVIMMSAEIGTALTPLIVRLYGWRIPFFVLAVIGVFWVVWWRRWYCDQPRDSLRITPAEIEEIGDGGTNSQHVLPWKFAMRSPNLWIIISAAVAFRSILPVQ